MFASRFALAAVVACVALPTRAETPPAPVPVPADAVEGVAAAEPTEAELKAAFMAEFNFVDGPTDGDLGEAMLKVPAGSMFAGKAGTNKWSVATSGREKPEARGLVNGPNGRWMVLFTYEETGHIKDDEKDDLNAGDLLDSYKEGQEEANEFRQQNGIEPIFIDGWEQQPAYNEQVKSLEWAITAHSPTSTRIVNFNTRLLGRTGVMSAVLMYGDDVQLKDIIGDFRTLMSGFTFKDGQRYSEFRDGDKLAEYGLAALVAGGGVALAAKTGLLAKFGVLLAKGGKGIILGIVAIGAGIANVFKRIFGKKDT
jgi:uncharacterized membrane-anchored protein